VDRDPRKTGAEIVQQVRKSIGPIAAFKTALGVDRLPKTRSGTMRRIADGEPYQMPATLGDPEVLSEIESAPAESRPESS